MAAVGKGPSVSRRSIGSTSQERTIGYRKLRPVVIMCCNVLLAKLVNDWGAELSAELSKKHALKGGHQLAMRTLWPDLFPPRWGSSLLRVEQDQSLPTARCRAFSLF